MALNVLMVDDDAQFLAYARDGLDGTVTLARTPLEAMWRLERERFDVVVCDLCLGSLDGTALLDEVRERWPTTSRVLVTGFGDKLVRDDLFPAAQAVIQKPCDLSALNALLDALPGRARRETLPP